MNTTSNDHVLLKQLANSPHTATEQTHGKQTIHSDSDRVEESVYEDIDDEQPGYQQINDDESGYQQINDEASSYQQITLVEPMQSVNEEQSFTQLVASDEHVDTQEVVAYEEPMRENSVQLPLPLPMLPADLLAL